MFWGLNNIKNVKGQIPQTEIYLGLCTDRKMHEYVYEVELVKSNSDVGSKLYKCTLADLCIWPRHKLRLAWIKFILGPMSDARFSAGISGVVG